MRSTFPTGRGRDSSHDPGATGGEGQGWAGYHPTPTLPHGRQVAFLCSHPQACSPVPLHQGQLYFTGTDKVQGLLSSTLQPQRGRASSYILITLGSAILTDSGGRGKGVEGITPKARQPHVQACSPVLTVLGFTHPNLQSSTLLPR